jgi:hypothetical protein
MAGIFTAWRGRGGVRRVFNSSLEIGGSMKDGGDLMRIVVRSVLVYTVAVIAVAVLFIYIFSGHYSVLSSNIPVMSTIWQYDCILDLSVMTAIWQLPITPRKAYMAGELPLVKEANIRLEHSWNHLHRLWDNKNYDEFWSVVFNLVDRSIYLRLWYVMSNVKLYNMLRDNEDVMIQNILNSVNFRIGRIASRAVLIPKNTYNADGSRKMRTLEVPSVAARIYLGVFTLIVSEFLEPTISRNQFGFRIGRAGYHAWLGIMRTILYYKSQGIDFRVYELDLLGFFPNIHKSLLRQMYMNQLKVPARFIHKVEAIDMIPLRMDSKIVRSETGLPQGAAPSPLLANLVLNELGLLDVLKGGSQLFQYADDCVIIGPAEFIMDDVVEYESRLRDGVGISKEKSGWNTSGILKFLGFTLDLSSGQFTATPRSGLIKDLGNIYIQDINSIEFELRIRKAFAVETGNVATNHHTREPRFRGITCQHILSLIKDRQS